MRRRHITLRGAAGWFEGGYCLSLSPFSHSLGRLSSEEHWVSVDIRHSFCERPHGELILRSRSICGRKLAARNRAPITEADHVLLDRNGLGYNVYIPRRLTIRTPISWSAGMVPHQQK